MEQQHVDAIAPVMANVTRLVEDATLLIQSDRMPSAFVLNVIALEEVGKVIQIRWEQLERPTTRQGRTGHLQKQWAVACLMIADKMLPFISEIVLNPAGQQAGMLKLAEAFIDSSERRFFEEVIAKNVDRAKQLGLYEDESNAREGRTRDLIDAPAVQQIQETLLKAVSILENELAVIVASVFYEIMPPLQEAILADRDKY